MSDRVQLRPADFVVGMRLTVERTEPPLALEVGEVKLHAAHALREGQPFSVQLVGGPSDRFLPQGTHGFTHPGIGRVELFVVPLGPEGPSMRYEIVFN